MIGTYYSYLTITHRLKRMQYVADIFFVLSGISMVDTVYAFLRRWFENYETYITYFYNKWVVFLLIAALLELYTTHRISLAFRLLSSA